MCPVKYQQKRALNTSAYTILTAIHIYYYVHVHTRMKLIVRDIRTYLQDIIPRSRSALFCVLYFLYLFHTQQQLCGNTKNLW